MAAPLSEPELRERVGRTLEIRGTARSPGAKGRIPDSVAAEAAAERLAARPAWTRAAVVTVNVPVLARLRGR